MTQDLLVRRQRQTRSHKVISRNSDEPLSSISFSEVNLLAQSFARHIESNFEKIVDILLYYESYEVAIDEIRRTLDHLYSLNENKLFFVLRIGAVTSFLPRNQPLYAFTCFVVIPSLMASEVHFRIPKSMRSFFARFLEILEVDNFFPNIIVSNKERLEFLKERSAILVDPRKQITIPITDAVIFTGTSHHAQQLRMVFDKRTLFIANGSGHNPVVVSKDANLKEAVEAAMSVQLYNSGQDCASPNAILVHKYVYDKFMTILKKEVSKINIGDYKNRICRVGPISEPESLIQIQEILSKNNNWIDSSTPGIVDSKNAIVQPTIICKPLLFGGNFSEVFSPIFFVQKYDFDNELSTYFENPLYAPHAMYISLFGKSAYIQKLVGRSIYGRVLHDKASIIINTHLHAQGVERGTQPYGGYGGSASSVSINGRIICKPTLPQRDIFECVARPLLNPSKLRERKLAMLAATEIITKDVDKLLKMKEVVSFKKKNDPKGLHYLDLAYVDKYRRFYQLDPKHIFSLLPQQNARYISLMNLKDIEEIRELRLSLINKKMDFEEMKLALYAIPTSAKEGHLKSREIQLRFFRNIYQLLFGNNSGPRLHSFLLEADQTKVLELLDI